MALSFPLTLSQFFDLLPASRVRMDPDEALDVSQTRGGEILTADLGESLWTGQIDLGRMLHSERADISPLINLLRRANGSFLVSDHTRPWPRLDPRGLILGAATPTILTVDPGMLELRLTGLPPGYRLSRGDLISWTYRTAPTRFALHEFVGSATATASGQTGLIEVSPPIREGVVAGTAVQLIWPRCKAKLVPGTADTGQSVRTITEGASLQWQQTLR